MFSLDKLYPICYNNNKDKGRIPNTLTGSVSYPENFQLKALKPLVITLKINLKAYQLILCKAYFALGSLTALDP